MRTAEPFKKTQMSLRALNMCFPVCGQFVCTIWKNLKHMCEMSVLNMCSYIKIGLCLYSIDDEMYITCAYEYPSIHIKNVV